MASQPFGLQDTTHLHKLSLVLLAIIVLNRTRLSDIMYSVPCGLGYQPRTHRLAHLLIRLIVLMPPTVRYRVDGPRRLPLALHATCLHRTPTKDSRQSSVLGLPLRATVVKLPFTESPQLMAPSGYRNNRI